MPQVLDPTLPQNSVGGQAAVHAGAELLVAGEGQQSPFPAVCPFRQAGLGSALELGLGGSGQGGHFPSGCNQGLPCRVLRIDRFGQQFRRHSDLGTGVVELSLQPGLPPAVPFMPAGVVPQLPETPGRAARQRRPGIVVLRRGGQRRQELGQGSRPGAGNPQLDLQGFPAQVGDGLRPLPGYAPAGV